MKDSYSWSQDYNRLKQLLDLGLRIIVENGFMYHDGDHYVIQSSGVSMHGLSFSELLERVEEAGGEIAFLDPCEELLEPGNGIRRVLEGKSAVGNHPLTLEVKEAIDSLKRRISELDEEPKERTMKWTFDNMGIGLTTDGNCVEDSKITRPEGLTNSDWYKFAGKVCGEFNKQRE